MQNYASHLRRFEALKSIRMPRETEWQQIADYFLPTKNFLINQPKGQSIPRRVMTSVPQRSLARFAAMLVGYLVNPAHPFIVANVNQGLVNSGRRLSIDGAARDYLDDLKWALFDHMMKPRSGFMSALSKIALDFAAFGTAVLWVGHKRGEGARYMGRSIRACYIDVNDDDQVDTLFYEFSLALSEVFNRWPDEAGKDEGLRKLFEDEKNYNKQIKVLHCIYPRTNGEVGSVAHKKPFAEVVLALEYKDCILSQSGYDSFPYAVPRLNAADGSPYGQGLCWQALPSAIVLNQLQNYVEYGIGMKVSPPAFMSRRLFKNKGIDRGVGAINTFDPAILGFQKLRDQIEYMQVPGDVGMGVEYMKLLEKDITDCMMVDWLSLPDNGNMTATEVNDRRQLRAVGLTGYLPALDRDLMGVIGDRTLEIMTKEKLIKLPPPQLSNLEVDWDYAGPLALAAQQAQIDGVRQLIAIAQQAAAIDPKSISILTLEEGLRMVAEGVGAPPSIVKSNEDMKALRAREAQAEAEAQEMQAAQMSAQALQAGGQGVASLTAAQGMEAAQTPQGVV